MSLSNPKFLLGHFRNSYSAINTPEGRLPWDHPRIRGEHFDLAGVVGIRAGIIPAYAGSTHQKEREQRTGKDHPRIRGEHVGEDDALGVPCGIIPAYAGSTEVVELAVDGHPGSSPHTRGARCDAASRLPLRTGSSPHTRGAPGSPRRLWPRCWDHPRIRGEHDHVRPARVDANGIIPAYAGSTPHHGFVAGPGRGSSPHTRGAPRGQ
jgi:hypothetical protein